MHFAMVGLEMIWDSNTFSMEEFNAYEKEWVLGFFTNNTIMPNIFNGVVGGFGASYGRYVPHRV
jgi:hypothetical protein